MKANYVFNSQENSAFSLNKLKVCNPCELPVCRHGIFWRERDTHKFDVTWSGYGYRRTPCLYRYQRAWLIFKGTQITGRSIPITAFVQSLCLVYVHLLSKHSHYRFRHLFLVGDSFGINWYNTLRLNLFVFSYLKR